MEPAELEELSRLRNWSVLAHRVIEDAFRVVSTLKGECETDSENYKVEALLERMQDVELHLLAHFKITHASKLPEPRYYALQSPAIDVDDRFASKLAFMLECMVLDPNGHYNAACELLDAYKSEWDKINPAPPTLFGEVLVRQPEQTE